MINKFKVFVLASLICSFSLFVWAEPQSQTESSSPVSSSTEETKKDENIENKDEKEGSEEEEKKDEEKDETGADVATDEVKNQAESPESNAKNKENTVINGEKALEVSAPMFPSKKEMDAKMQEEIPSILGVLDILKELNEANLFFSAKKDEAIAKKDEMSSRNEAVSTSVPESLAKTDVKSEELIAQAESETRSEDDGELHDEVNEEDEEAFIIDDFAEENEESGEREVHAGTYDDGEMDDFLTFDEEHGFEGKMPSVATKQEEITEKGQLSSIVEEEDDKVNISRYTNIKKGQRIDFSYPGEGWVYLGEENAQKGLNYTKRKMEGGKTFFSFKAEAEGNFVLNFSYFDAFSGDFIVDAVSVKVLPSEGTQSDALVVDYQQKKEKGETKEELAKVTEGAAAGQESVRQQADVAQTEKKTPNDVSIDSSKVGMKVQDEAKQSEKSSDGSTVAKQEKSEMTKEKKEEKATASPVASTEGKTSRDAKEGQIQRAQPQKDVQVKKEAIPQKEKAPSSKKKETSPYKEPEVLANVATLSVANAGKKEGDEESAKAIIEKADAAVSSGDAEAALQSLEDFFAIASSDIDKAYLLQGKAYELNGKRKNIKLALQAYKFLAKTFPESKYRALANERIRYIEKFFVNIK